MNEPVFFGERLYSPGDIGSCPDIRPDGIYLDGHRVIRLGLQGVGVGENIGDLLAYRQLWEPYIQAHLNLWRNVNELLESTPTAKKCPKGIFKMSEASKELNDAELGYCASLNISRMYTSSTYPLGILTQWNAWSGKSSSEILAGAKSMLEWHQGVVMSVGGPYKDELFQIANIWGLAVELPEVPEFSKQQEIRARIEGAYITAKGVLQIIGYGIGETLEMAGTTAEAVAVGLQETAKKLPGAVPKPWTWVAITGVLAVVGAGVLIYYVPRTQKVKAAA
ncbi:hypothetical protein LCGC14_1528010 [marine sediment metagenome]|uniref:Uncharacterized protein n=1 Tax=marine sediment metagenome TaxID=412755 RepID=A0A0F9IX35_9ZZZZ